MKLITEMPDNYFVTSINLEGLEPYAVACPKDGIMEPEEKFAIPYALAYFLRVHWSGTDDLRLLHRRELANQIKSILNI